MAVNCTTIGYAMQQGYQEDWFCLPMTVTLEGDEWNIDEAWIAGAFFLGLIVGGALTALCVRPFLAAWAKKKRQDEEKLLEDGGYSYSIAASPVPEDKHFKSLEAVPLDRYNKKEKGRKKSARFSRRKKVKDGDGGQGVKVDLDESLCKGMVDVLSQTNGVSSEVEMADQDLSAIVAMERSQEQEKETLLVKVLGYFLRKKADKRMVTDNFCENFIIKTEQNLRDTRHMLDREKEEEEEKLKNDNKLAKDPQALETEMQNLQTKFNHKGSKLQRDHKENIRADLIKSSGMSEEEVEGVMEKLTAQMSNLEEKLGQEQSRQRRVLEERLAKRRQVVEYKDESGKEQEDTRQQRVETMRDLLKTKVMNGQLLEQKSDELMKQYEGNLNHLYDGLNAEQTLHWNDLSEELHSMRLNEMQNLAEKQAQERGMFKKKTEQASSVADIVKGYHELLSRQHAEQEKLSNKLDERDVQKMEEMKKDLEKSEERGMREESEKLLESLQNVSDVTNKEADRILQQHKAQMEDHKARQQREKQAMLARLQEKLQQRLAMASEAEARDSQEQEMLCQEQAATIGRVLASNIDLTEEAKDKILKQHEQNMQALSNQLQRSKMRQQKSLEMKLNQRKARLADLQKKKDDLKRKSSNMKESEVQKQEQEIEQQMGIEENKLEEARKAAVSELRKQLAAETAAALKQQDEEIGLLIGRLQVGQARRKTIIERQDKTLKELQDQLEDKVAAGEPGSAAGVADNLMQQHYNTVEHLNNNMQRHRQTQERQLAEKVKQKKKHREQEIETQLEVEAQQEYSDQQKSGAGYASLALMQTFLEQKHQRAMTELETQMTAELEKEKDELNRQIEGELQKELQTQRQSLLTNLAAMSNLSHKELESAVDAAVNGKQSDKQAKKLAKDLKQGIERAKTSMSMEYGEARRDGLDMRRTRTDLEAQDVDQLGPASPMSTRRPGSSKKFVKKKAAFAGVHEEDGDSF